MKTYLWQITAKTNLHVGNENSTSYGIIDKAVQRDVLTGLPCINASSLKGAINEFCIAEGILSPKERVEIFGSDKRGKLESKKGKAIFYDAQILFLPVQDDKSLFTYATSEGVLEQTRSRLELFGFKNVNFNQFEGTGKRKYNKSWERDDFSSLCSDENLPIIARNVLDNGVSKNLWYEQVVPAETIFYAVIQEPDFYEIIQEPDTPIKKSGGLLAEAIMKKNKLIQIGANATIGYGYCKFDLIAKYDDNKGKE